MIKQRGGAVISTVTSQQEGCGFEPGSRLERLHVLPVPVWVSSGSAGFRSVHTVGANVSVNARLFLC